jgi:Txe/YoeB family toxin of Txe-Axe toxin-antitoxin module
MKKAYKVFFITEKTKDKYVKLRYGNDADKRLYKYITKAIEEISNNPFIGIRLHKTLVPVEYKKFGVEKLLKYDLPKGWRLIYTLTNEEIDICAVVIEWFNHKNYEKRFSYAV